MVRSSLGAVFVIGICVLGVAQVDAGNKCVCEEAGLIGAAYGACNRYCEVLNCDAPNPDGSANACNRVMDRFFELTGDLPPCEPVCPCAEGWLHPEFVPEGEVAASCYIQKTDFGVLIDFSVEGSPDENGNPPVSFAAVDIFDDEEERFHRVGCFSERYENPEADSSEDSGGFEMVSGFAEKSLRFNRQQRRIFKSCRSIVKRLIKKTGAECEIADLRTE